MRLEMARQLEKELQRRKRENKIEFYFPHPKQMEFHKAAETYLRRICITGNRGGKTTAGCIEAVMFATGEHRFANIKIPVPNEGWIVSPTHETAHSVCYPKFMEYLPKRFFKKFFKRDGLIELTNGSLVRLKSLQQGTEAQSGASIAWALLDEEHPEDKYNEIAARVLDQGGHIWQTLTPVSGMSWVLRKVVNRSDIKLLTWTIWDNPYLDIKQIEQFERDLTTEEERRARLYGEFSFVEGLAFPEFNFNVHVIKPLMREEVNPQWTHVIGIDTGRRFAAVFMAIDFRGNYIVYDSYYAKDNPTDIDCANIKKILDKYEYMFEPPLVCDPASQVKPNLRSRFQVVMDGVKGLNGDIDIVRNLMKYDESRPLGRQNCNPRIYITMNNDILIGQIQNWRYKTHKSYSGGDEKTVGLTPKLQEGYDLCAALCYGATSSAANIPEEPRGERPKTFYQSLCDQTLRNLKRMRSGYREGVTVEELSKWVC